MGFLVQLGALVQSHCICTLVMKPAFKRQGGQPDQMGVAAAPKYKEGAHWIHKKRKEFGGSNQKYFDYHTFYIGYRGCGAYPQRKFSQLHSLQYRRKPLCQHN